MELIEELFYEVRSWREGWNTLVSFCEATRGRKFNKELVSKYFYKLVNPVDYIGHNQESLIEYIFFLSNRYRVKKRRGRWLFRIECLSHFEK
jgi:hypothetical protein